MLRCTSPLKPWDCQLQAPPLKRDKAQHANNCKFVSFVSGLSLFEALGLASVAKVLMDLRFVPSEAAPGKGTLQPLGRNEYRVCGPAGCTVVKGYANALYLSRNVPEADAKGDGGEQLPPYWGSRDGFPLHS
jgi:hypothetical protein